MKGFICCITVVIVMSVASCHSGSSTGSQNTKDSVDWKDSIIDKEAFKAAKSVNGVVVWPGGTHSDIVLFLRGNASGPVIAVDPIRNGDCLSSRCADGDYQKMWIGTGWNDCNIYPCSDMDFYVRDIGNNVTFVAARHGGYRDLVYCYAVVGNTVYRSKEWGDFGPGQLKHGIAISFEGNSFKIEGYPWSNGDDGLPTPKSSNGRISFDITANRFSYSSSDDNLLWSKEATHQEKTL